MLFRSAMEAAQKGNDSLNSWWKSISKDERTALDQDVRTELRQIANDADAIKEKTDENV